MIDYNLGSTYRNKRIDTKREIIPTHASFRSFAGETHCFDEREGNISFFQITNALETGAITPLDKTVICLTATFGSACITSKVLKELLTMMGCPFNDNVLESSLKRLHRFQLINFSRFTMRGTACATIRIITLTNYGSQLAKALGTTHRYNALAIASAEAYAVKSRAETAQLICNYLKNLPIESFAVRPVIATNPEEGAIIRPAASIVLCGETIYFEVPRCHDGYLEEITDKLQRYEKVFDGKGEQTIIINGEDENMNKEINSALSNASVKMEIFFTEDLLCFGADFENSLYTFDSNGVKQCFCIVQKEAS